MDPLSLLWLFFILASLQPALERRRMAVLRWKWLRRLSRKRGRTVITLIHRQETMSLLGFPLVRYIDVDDAESVLRAIRDTPQGDPIEIILRAPGGLVRGSARVARGPHPDARRHRLQGARPSRALLARHMAHDRARDVARLLASGRWTHDYPLHARDVEALGLPVRVGVPQEERELMLLYPPPRGREPAVEYVPGSPERPWLPARRGRRGR